MQGSWRQALGLERICLPGRCGATLALDREAAPVDFMRTCDEAPGCDALGTCDMVGDVSPVPLNSTEEAAMLRRCFDVRSRRDSLDFGRARLSPLTRAVSSAERPARAAAVRCAQPARRGSGLRVLPQVQAARGREEEARPVEDAARADHHPEEVMLKFASKKVSVLIN